MQRLTDLFRGARLSGERGATAVLFALLLVPLLGFAAIAVDVGSLYAERARLQVAADAAAIAVAQDCSRGNCGDMLATARGPGRRQRRRRLRRAAGAQQRPAQRHRHRPHARCSTGSRRSSATTPPRSRRRATVGWGAPERGHRASLPLTFSWCEFSPADRRRPALGHGRPHDLLHEDVEHDRLHRPVEQRRPRRLRLPEHRPGQVRGHHRIWPASGCPTPATACRRPARRRTSPQWVGQTVLLPLFDESGATGSNAWYRVYGYAAFKLTGYCARRPVRAPAPSRARGNERCVTGYFTRFVDLSRRLDLQPRPPRSSGPPSSD